MIRVIIADDHDLFRQGLRRLLKLETDIQVVAEAANGLEVQSMVEGLEPDVVLMDIGMPIVDGISATREISSRWPDTKVIALTMYWEDGYVFRAIQAGAHGYLLKTAQASEVVGAIRAVSTGASPLEPTIAGKVLREFRRMAATNGSQDGLGGISATEITMLRLLSSGLSNKQIARKMGLAQSTVKNRLSILFSKIDVHDRTQAAIFAISHGLLPQGPSDGGANVPSVQHVAAMPVAVS